ncbi:TIGR04255 family protein [Vibrio parahaemolyticus]|uniref:TIGR04255 family protein n=1 Tax=Vibrio parahaemolyticus TaxID=670 RepID=UPI00226B5A0A|nr:TIGR04255 family protein [Vibrio parahaemolyticus]MCX8843663.1 TIGR04255 family protein [Vibrio parahaemolyticus]HCG7082750.1 TIGR04255 family protein [Vibrio parahaemolyticus]
MQQTPPHLSNPPLIMALARVEFAKLPQAKLEGSIDSLHDMLRAQYPDITKGFSNNVNLNLSNTDSGDLASNIVSEKTPFWLFRSANYDWSVQIDVNGVLVCTKAYSSSEDLCHRIRNILDALDTAIKITHTRYVGVRFINKIDIDTNGQFSALRPGYIQQQLSFTEGMGGSSYTARYKVDGGWLDIRSDLVVGGYEVADDLREIAAQLNLAKEPVNEVFVTLDFDCKHVSENFESYDLNQLCERIISLTEQGKLALVNVLTEDEIERRK